MGRLPLPANHGFLKDCYGEISFEGGRSEQRVVFGIKEYKGRKFFAIQNFWEDTDDSSCKNLKPGKQSPSIRLDDMPEFFSALSKVKKYLEDRGYEIKEGGGKGKAKKSNKKAR